MAEAVNAQAGDAHGDYQVKRPAQRLAGDVLEASGDHPVNVGIPKDQPVQHALGAVHSGVPLRSHHSKAEQGPDAAADLQRRR